jgi:hypothetical protein
MALEMARDPSVLRVADSQTVVGCVIGSTLGSGTGGAPFFGVLLMILGGGLWQRFSRKACPACAERVNLQAAKCPNCAADLRA